MAAEVIRLRSARDYHAWATGDWHCGSAWCDTDLLTRHRQMAVDGGWGLLHVGDSLEMVTPASRVALRGALREQILDPEQQRQALIGYLRGLREGVILPGNHELRIDMMTGLDFIKSVSEAKDVHVRPLTIPQVVRIDAGRQTYHVYLHHGEGPVVSPTTLFDRIQRDVHGLDLILAGHIHASTSDPSEVETPQGPRIVHRLRAGHYLKTPPYALARPITRRGARGSWHLIFRADRHAIDAIWLGS